VTRKQSSPLSAEASRRSPGAAYAATVGAKRSIGLVGSTEPRICTPPRGKLTPETSKGFACIAFAEEILEIELLPWQRALLIRALELNPDGSYRFRTVLLLVARQNGKSTLMQVLSLWSMYAEGAPLVIGTAQSLDIAEEQWMGAVEIAEGIPELAELIEHVDRTNGKKALRLDSGERYKVTAASRRGGRGLSGDLVLLDELREHQNWQAWGAVTKTTMARRRAQVWAASNAGDITSVVLRHLRSLAHRALAWPDGKDGMASLTDVEDDGDDSLGIFEWSAAPGRGIRDKAGWAEANPSLGYTIDERAISAAAGTDPEGVFRTEVLCQFVDTVGTGPFSEGSWEGTRVASVQRDTDKPFGYCVDISYDRKMAYIAVGFYDSEGRIRGEIAAARAGTDWIVPWLQSPERRVRPTLVTLQTNGAPVSSMVPAFQDAGIELVQWAGADLVRSSGIVYDAVHERTVTHGTQAVLDVAAMTAVTKPAADGWLIDRKHSIEDAAPLIAWMGAVWLIAVHGADNGPSIYETRGLALA
jgi:hypothetical protein